MSSFESSAPGSRHAPPPPWEKIAAPPMIEAIGGAAWRAVVPDGALHAFRAREDGLWHLSVSHTSRLPSFDELTDARYRFVPDRARMAQLFPPRAEWVNVHPRTLHLWELDAQRGEDVPDEP